MNENQCVTIKKDLLYINFKNLRDIYLNLDIIKENIRNGIVNQVIFISDFSPNAECCCSLSERKLIIQFLNQTEVLTLAVFGKHCFPEIMDVMLFCDLNLCFNSFVVDISRYQCEELFSFEQQLRFRIGSKAIFSLDEKISGNLDAERLLELNLMNEIIDESKAVEEVQNYLDKLIDKKGKRQVDLIISNHKSFRNMNLTLSNDFLAFKEANYFCMLVADTYMFE